MFRTATLIALLIATLLCDHGTAKGAEARAHYRIDVAVDPKNRSMVADTRMRIPADAAARTQVEFRLRADMGTPRVEALGASAAQRTIRVSKLGEEKGDVVWRVTPARPFPGGRPIDLRVRSSGGATVSQLFYIGPEIVFVGGGSTAWYPQFGDGRGQGTLTLRLPRGFRAVATAPEARESGSAATFETKWPTHFGFTAGPYVVREQQAGGRRIRLLLLRDRDFGAELADVAGKSLAILENEFGRYPFGDFAIAEIPSGPGSKAGFLGAAFDGYMLMRSDLLDARRADPQFFGHEIGHQWWGVSVQNPTDDGEYMLDEALAHYGSLRVVEELLGAEAGIRQRRGLGHWDGVLDAAQLIAAGVDAPLAALPVSFGHYELSHSKAGLVYMSLAREIGPERFRAMLGRLTAEHAYSTLSWPTMRAALTAEIGQSRETLLAQWLDRPGLPVLDHSWKQEGGKIFLQVEQAGQPYDLAMPFRLNYSDGTAELRTLGISGASSSIELSADRPVIGIDMDPFLTIPWIAPTERDASIDAAYATRARLLWDQGKSDEAAVELRRGLAARSAGEGGAAGPGAFLERLYLGWIEHNAGRPREALELFDEALRLPVRVEEDLAQLYWRINRSAMATGNAGRARWAASAVLAITAAPPNLERQARQFLADQGPEAP